MGFKKGIKELFIAGDGLLCLLTGAVKYASTSFKKGVFNTCYDIAGNQELRNKVHSELEERANSMEERETGTVFIMPKGKRAFRLGRRDVGQESDKFILDIYSLGRVRSYSNLKSCKPFLGREVYNSLTNESPSCVTRYKSSLKGDIISMVDIKEPRIIYVEPESEVTNEIPREDNVVLDSENTEKVSNMALASKEGV